MIKVIFTNHPALGVDSGILNMYRREFDSMLIEFIKTCNQDYNFETFKWDVRRYPLYLVIDEHNMELIGFFTLSFTSTIQGTVVNIVHGYCKPKHPEAIKYMFSFIDSYVKEFKIIKVMIATKRNADAFSRYFSKFGYKQSDVIFERNYIDNQNNENSELEIPNENAEKSLEES